MSEQDKDLNVKVKVALDTFLLSDLVAHYLRVHGGYNAHAVKGAVECNEDSDEVEVFLLDQSRYGPRFVDSARRRCALPRIVVVADSAFIIRAISKAPFGVCGVVPKDYPARRVRGIIDLVSCGETYFPLYLTEKIGVGSSGNGKLFSEKEMEVLEFLALGKSNTEIANEVGLSTTTVKTYISKILKKTGHKSRVQAALYCHGV